MRVTVDVPVVAFSDADLTKQSLDITLACSDSCYNARVEITLASGDTVSVLLRRLSAAVDALKHAADDDEPEQRRHGAIK